MLCHVPTVCMLNISKFLGVHWHPDTDVDERIPGISVLCFTSKQFEHLKNFTFGWFESGEYVWTYQTINYLGHLHGPTLYYETSDLSLSGFECFCEKQRMGVWTKWTQPASNRSQWIVQGESVCYRLQQKIVGQLSQVLPAMFKVERTLSSLAEENNYDKTIRTLLHFDSSPRFLEQIFYRVYNFETVIICDCDETIEIKFGICAVRKSQNVCA
jgi:hypothetical protein